MFESNFVSLLNSKQLEYYQKETSFYLSFINAFGLKDNFKKNIYQNFKNQIDKIDIDELKNRYKKGDRKGMAINKYYQLISDNNI